MHGPTTLDARVDTPGVLGRTASWIRRNRKLCFIVFLPTLIVAAYFYLIASDQYESEAHFVVRTADAPQPKASGLGVALGMAGASASQPDALIVVDYLASADAVDALRQRIDLVDRFQRPGVDPISRLWWSNPTPEVLLKYYLNMVDVKVHTDTGIATLDVRAFDPKDSLVIAQALLHLAEERVNVMNKRNYDSAVSVAMTQVQTAERDVANVQARMTAFRRDQRDFDPTKTGSARVQLVGELQGRLAAARAQAQAMATGLNANAPQLVAQRAAVAALQRQVAAEQSQISAGPGNVATGLGTYENLQMRQDFASKEYEAASTALQEAKTAAAKQQLFIVRVVDPGLPVDALYPKSTKIVLTVFIAMMLIYGIGWLIAAGVKEHAA